MKEIAASLNQIIVDYTARLYSIGEGDYAKKANPGKWSKKEIVGHLIDSAQNNIRRFVVARYELAPVIIYDQDRWVSVSNYQQFAVPDLVELWILLNRQICFIMLNTDEGSAARICKTNDDLPHTIEWLAGDYIRHLLHHLHQVCDQEPAPYP
jgi:hypothetical protein